MKFGLPHSREHAETQHELQHLHPLMIAERLVVPAFECGPALTRLVQPWTGLKPWAPKRRHFKRALGRQLKLTGLAARTARATSWRSAEEEIATALEAIPWHTFTSAPGLTTYDTQLWTKLRHRQLRVWGRPDGEPGCARRGCASMATAGTEHIVWSCTKAVTLWRKVAALWGSRAITDEELKTAVFARRPPASIYDWRELFPERATEVSDRLAHWLRTTWTQLITRGIQRLWSRTVASSRGEDDADSDGDFFAVVHHWAGTLRGAISATLGARSDTRLLDVRILRALYKGLVVRADKIPEIRTAGTKYLLFFDGGSRGNPGPGGSGAVIVQLDAEPRVVWAASMSYANRATTNNYAEYQGLCTGLARAEAAGMKPLAVIGDSMMIIRQMLTRRKPKAPALRPLYEQARAAADALRVGNWHHHYRSRNKMADKAANQAMDSGASYQAGVESGRRELTALSVWLANDVSQWVSRDTYQPPGG